MRIVSGKYRRRKLLAKAGPATRPIPDRVKELVFAHLADRVVDQRVADVFAGTGTIGLEALSRGARSVVFIEKDRRAFELLKQNVVQLRVEDQTLCWHTDVLKTSFHPKSAETRLPYDLVFVDPPYRMIPQLESGSRFYKSLSRLARDSVSAPDALLLLRTPERASFEWPAVWNRHNMIKISSMEIHWFRKTG